MKLRIAATLCVALFSSIGSNVAFADGGQCAYLRDFTKMVATKRDAGVPEETFIDTIYAMAVKGAITEGDADAKIGVVKQIYEQASGLNPSEVSALYYGNCRTAEISRR